MPNNKIPWPHAPIHKLDEGGGVFMVTAGTYRKEHFFKTAEELNLLHGGLLSLAKKYQVELEAWAVFSNHYHFIGRMNAGDNKIAELAKELHARTAIMLNKVDGASGRKVWHNYWDTKLTYQKSYLSRLNYVHQNAVKHGLVKVANQYPWCSARWFERVASLSQVQTIYSCKIDRLNIKDDF